MTTDYDHFGRQIALPEMGARGQAALALTHVRAPGEVTELAAKLWRAAGGGEGTEAAPTLGVAFETQDEAVRACQSLGVAAWCCVESARGALGLGEAAELPAELLRRLTPPRAAPP